MEVTVLCLEHLLRRTSLIKWNMAWKEGHIILKVHKLINGSHDQNILG